MTTSNEPGDPDTSGFRRRCTRFLCEKRGERREAYRTRVVEGNGFLGQNGESVDKEMDAVVNGTIGYVGDVFHVVHAVEVNFNLESELENKLKTRGSCPYAIIT